MKSFLAALRDNWLAFLLIPLIVGSGYYIWHSPDIEAAKARIDDGEYDEALALLEGFHRSWRELPPEQEARLRWLMAELILRRNQDRSTLTIGDIREAIELLEQAREGYLAADKKTVPKELYVLWLETIEAFKQVNGHKEALAALSELARLQGDRPDLLLVQAAIERERPGRMDEALRLIERYLALKKLSKDERRIGLSEQALAYQLRAEDLELGLAGGTGRLRTFDHLLGIAQRISADYGRERKLREGLLKEATTDEERLIQRFELGRLAFREARVLSKLLRYGRKSSSRRDPQVAVKLRARIKQGLDSAVKELQTYVKKAEPSSQLGRAYFMIGESARLLGHRDEALKAFRKLEKYSDQPQIDALYFSMRGKAQISMERGDWAEFQRAAPRLTVLAQGDPRQQYELAVMFEAYRDRRLDAHRVALKKAIEAARRRAETAEQLAELRKLTATQTTLVKARWNRQAAEMYLWATRIKPHTRAAEAALRALDLFKRTGNTAAAIQACDRYLDTGVQDSNISQVLLQKGQLLRSLGLGPEAIEAFEQTIKAGRRTFQAYTSLLAIGDTYAEIGETEQALKIYRKIQGDTRFDPSAPIWRDALYREGVTLTFSGLAQTGKTRDATLLASVAVLRQFNERYKTHPMVRRADFYQGLAWLAMGKWARAEQIFGRLSATRVYDEEPDVARRRRIYRLSTYLHAVAYLRSIRVAKSPPGPKEWKRAIELLETAISRFDVTPQAVWASSALVGLYHQVGDDPQATRVGRRAVWLAKKVGKKDHFDAEFWGRWVNWKMAVLTPESAEKGKGK